ncbi:MAG: pantetheine-phosphate adenylyltransferase [Paludibacteraceae bacterium]|nr:pantetheine-phosphate adenylyltransferase [Paludibacteraceae bacterium]
MTRRAIFPGSFDPFTIGHYRIVQRALDLFDHIIIGVGVNTSKRHLFALDTRLDIIRQAFASEPRVTVKSYDGLTMDFAQEADARFILRGLRSTADFEYERTLAEANLHFAGIETVALYTEPDQAFVSSTVVRDMYTFGKDIAPLLPPGVVLPDDKH